MALLTAACSFAVSLLLTLPSRLTAFGVPTVVMWPAGQCAGTYCKKQVFLKNLSLFGLSWGKLWVFCSRKRTNVNSAYFNILSEFVLDLSPSTELCESISFPRPYSQYQSTDECVSLVQPEHLKKTHFSTLRSPLYNHSVSRSGSGDIMDSFIKINFRGQVDPLHLFFCSRTHCLQISVIIIYLSAGLVIIS